MGRYIKLLTNVLNVVMGFLVILGCMIEGYATAYTTNKRSVTYTNEIPYEGGCAGSKEYIGKVVVLFQRLPGNKVGDIIGFYECNDTGGTEGIKNGTVIDVYKDDIEKCQDFMDSIYQNGCQGKVFIQIFEKN